MTKNERGGRLGDRTAARLEKTWNAATVIDSGADRQCNRPPVRADADLWPLPKMPPEVRRLCDSPSAGIGDAESVVDIDDELAAADWYQDERGVPLAPAHVEPVGRGLYVPREDGWPALLVGVVEAGELIDIAAIVKGPRTLTRLGNARVLGGDAIERTRFYGASLDLVERPADWLQRPNDSAMVIDWRRAPLVLSDHPVLRCATPRLAAQVHAAFHRPVFRIPRLLVPV